MNCAPRPPFSLPVALPAAALVCSAWAAAAADGAQPVPGDGVAVDVPSGQAVTLLDVISNVPGPDGLTLRFRFLAPSLADRTADFDVAAADMQHLCDRFAIPRLSDFGPVAQQVVISMSSQAVPFGQTAPDVVQFFESYRIEDGICVWEMF